MRILDTDIQEIVSKMLQAELDRFWSSIYTKTIYEQNINPFIDSSTIQDSLKEVGKIEESKFVDDDKAINEITDKDEKAAIQLLRAPIIPNGPKRAVRSIPRGEIKKLITRAQIMNSGKKYAQQFTSMSRKEILDFKLYDKSINISDDSKYLVDSEYGINTIEKHSILEILESQAYAKELVAKIPEKKLEYVKRKFEHIRNNPSMIYDNPKRELDAMITQVFGEQADQSMLYNIAMVDFANAFGMREKALEEKSKDSLWSKIKNLFSRSNDKPKALPEGHPNDE